MVESTTGERWLPIPRFGGEYEASDQGRVRGVDRVLVNRHGHSRLWRGRIRALVPDRTGYLAVRIHERGYAVHRLILEAFVGPCPGGMETLHRNGVRDDNRVENLTWGTPSENGFDRVRHRTHPKVLLTHCPRGHPLEAPNLRPAAARRGFRTCWSCAIARGSRVGDETDFSERANRVYADLLGGWRPVPQPAKVACPRGHLLARPNLVVSMLPRRNCLACRRGGSVARSRGIYGAAIRPFTDAAYAQIMGSRDTRLTPT